MTTISTVYSLTDVKRVLTVPRFCGKKAEAQIVKPGIAGDCIDREFLSFVIGESVDYSIAKTQRSKTLYA